MLLEKEFIYKSIERPFIEYFDRMLDSGNDFKQIENQLPYLEKYYLDMVITELDLRTVFKFNPTIYSLFKKWKNFRG